MRNLKPPGMPGPVNELEEYKQLVDNVSTLSRQWIQQLQAGQRDVYDECHYPHPDSGQFSTDLYRQLYDREPIATRAIELIPKECWQVQPLVFEDPDAETETPFEQAWDALGSTLRGENCWYQDEAGSPIWEHLKRVDILSGIGSFGVLLLGIDDRKNLQEPVDGVMVYNDSPMTKQEEERLRKPRARWDGDALGEAPLTTNERAAVDMWAEERKAIHNRDRKLRRKARRTQNSNGDFTRSEGRYDTRTAERDQGMHHDPRAPTGRARTVSGTDLQYDGAGLGIGMPPPQASGMGVSLSGTDQQYFGVQFGPSEVPAPEPAKEPRKLLFLRAFDETLVQIVRYEWNIRSPRFGMPVMYRVTLNDPREVHSGVGLPLATVYVHWSRLIHVADNLRSSEIFGVPRLRPIVNAILDHQKVRGAGCEGYWSSCFTGLQFSTHPALGPDASVDMDEASKTARDYQATLKRFLIGIGGQWSTLAPSVVDPTPHISLCLQDICIYLGCPLRVFQGAERGQLASQQDDDNWNDRKRERNNSYTTPRLIVPFVDRCIQIGVLPEPGKTDPKVAKEKLTGNERCGYVRKGSGSYVQNADGTRSYEPKGGYSVEWPPMDSMGQQIKAQVGLTKCQNLTTFIAGNGEAGMPLREFYVHMMNMTEEQADSIIKANEKHSDDTMTIPPMGARGHPATPTPMPPKPPPMAQPKASPTQNEYRARLEALLHG